MSLEELLRSGTMRRPKLNRNWATSSLMHACGDPDKAERLIPKKELNRSCGVIQLQGAKSESSRSQRGQAS